MWDLCKSLESHTQNLLFNTNPFFLIDEKIEKKSDFLMPSSSNEVIHLFEAAAPIVILFSSC